MPLKANQEFAEWPRNETWGAQGGAGVTLLVRRKEDGSAVFGTYHEKDETAQAYCLHVPAEGVMDLMKFLMNKPETLN